MLVEVRTSDWMEDCEKLCVGWKGMLRNMGGNNEGNLNAITHIAAGVCLCGKTDSGHTFRYLYIYLGDSI